MILLFILYFSIQIQANYCQAPLPQDVNVPKGYQIMFVQTLTRHGDRSPMNTFVGDDAYYDCSSKVYSSVRSSKNIGDSVNTMRVNVIDKIHNIYAKNYMFKGDCEITQLTKKGVQQHHQLGVYQRNKYLKLGLIPSMYDSNKIYIRSTERSRTLQSSQAFIQTFYPKSTRNNKTSVTPIFVLPLQVETMFPNRGLCQAINKKEKETYSLDIVKNTRHEIKQIEDKAIRVMQFKSTHPWLEDYVDILNCRICSNQSLPCNGDECLTIDDYNTLWYQTQLENRYLFRTDGLAQLQIGLFMKELVERAEMVFNHTSTYVYEHYTGHDSTLMPFLALIGQDVFIWPPYASHIDIEHFVKDGEYYMRVVYNNDVLHLPFCKQKDGMCTFKEYRDYVMNTCVVSIDKCKI